MTDQVMNIAKLAGAQLVRDNLNSMVVLLLTANEADAALLDHEDVAAMLLAAGNTEAVDASAARKTALSATVGVDHPNDRVDIDMDDVVFASLAGIDLTKAIIAVSTGAGDANLIPLVHMDFVVSPDGTNVTMQFNASGFARSQNL